MSQILDAAQLAETLGVNAETIRRLTRDGTLPHHKFGGTIRYHLPDILKATAVEQHPDDEAVDKFAAAMHARMTECRLKGKEGWDDPERCPLVELEHRVSVALMDAQWVDVANFAMMLWARGAK